MKKEKWMGLAALGSAALASLCCIGPAVFIALGIGSLGAFSVFETYRPVFMGLTILVLAAAFYFTYRKREVECKDGSCQMAGGSHKAMLWAATFVAAGFISSPYWLSAIAGTGKAAPTILAAGTYQTVALDVEGMTCEACGAHIRKNLKQVPGVLEASVDYPSKQAIVYCAKGKVSNDALLKAVSASGYSATVNEERS